MVAVISLTGGCGSDVGRILPNEATAPVDTDRFELVARLVQITDAQIVDEESPGRLAFFASLTRSAWRSYEAYSTQLLDGMIRTVNKLHVARHRIDFLIQTGDAVDNVQLNELGWFITAFDGGMINPRSGPDDRDPGDLPDPLLDPHHPFTAQGLYQNGVHGPAPTIPWYTTLGNHDRFAVGVLPILPNLLGIRTAPAPLQPRIGLFLPVELNPVGTLSWALITPAHPGPPPALTLPTVVVPNPARRFVTDRDFVQAHLASTSDPPGHGFTADHPDRTWYSVSPVSGLRLITLNSSTPAIEQPEFAFSEGAISYEQRLFLERELQRAQARDEWVIVATHHPSSTLELIYGTSLGPHSFRTLLNKYPCVKLHLGGHLHVNVVIDRGGYRELLTSSILDAPQQGRVIEIWRDASGQADLRYWMFSHLEAIDPTDDSQAALFDDPLMPMRRKASELAGVAR